MGALCKASYRTGILALACAACAAVGWGLGAVWADKSEADFSSATQVRSLGPKVQLTRDGRSGLSVWLAYHMSTPPRSAFVSRRSAQGGWEGERVFFAAHKPSDFVLAMNARGEAWLAWVEDKTRVQLRRYVQGQWGPIQSLVAIGQNPEQLSLAINDQGEAVLAWSAFDGKYTSVYASRYWPASARWTAAVEIDLREQCPLFQLEAGNAFRPTAKLASDGRARVLFVQQNPCDNMGTNPLGNIYAVEAKATGWSQPVEIDEYDWDGNRSGGADFPVLDMEQNMALGCWIQSVPGIQRARLFVALSTETSAWRRLAWPLEPEAEDANTDVFPGSNRCAVNGRRAAALYLGTLSRASLLPQGAIFAAVLDTSSAAKPNTVRLQRLDTATASSITPVAVAIADRGDVWVVWIANNRLYGALAKAGEARFGEKQLIADAGALELHEAALAMARSRGEMLLAWEASGQVYASWYDPATQRWSAAQRLDGP